MLINDFNVFVLRDVFIETQCSWLCSLVFCGYWWIYILIVITWFYTCMSLSMQSALMC